MKDKKKKKNVFDTHSFLSDVYRQILLKTDDTVF